VSLTQKSGSFSLLDPCAEVRVRNLPGTQEFKGGAHQPSRYIIIILVFLKSQKINTKTSTVDKTSKISIYTVSTYLNA
jgi:hypothetical protein